MFLKKRVKVFFIIMDTSLKSHHFAGEFWEDYNELNKDQRLYRGRSEKSE